MGISTLIFYNEIFQFVQWTRSAINVHSHDANTLRAAVWSNRSSASFKKKKNINTLLPTLIVSNPFQEGHKTVYQNSQIFYNNFLFWS